MKAQELDYVIVADPSKANKNYLVQVTKLRSDSYKGILEEDRHIKEEHFKFSQDDVVVNLGPKPTPGVLYGVDARDIFRKSITHDAWGEIYFFTRLEKPVLKALRKSLDRTASIIEKSKLDNLFNHFHTEIRFPRGKYAGMYNHSKNKDKPNRVKLFLKEDHVSEMDYVLLHEFGHAIRFNCLTNPKIVSAWLNLFNTSILVEPVTESEFAKMLKHIKKSGAESLGKLRGTFDEDDEDSARIMKTAIRFISQVHKVRPNEVSTLMEAGKYDTLEDLWPSRDIDVNDLQPIVSEYATKNVEELFAEAYSLHVMHKKLPKRVVQLLEKSLSVAKDTVKHLAVSEE